MKTNKGSEASDINICFSVLSVKAMKKLYTFFTQLTRCHTADTRSVSYLSTYSEYSMHPCYSRDLMSHKRVSMFQYATTIKLLF